MKRPPFSEAAKRKQLADRLSGIEGVFIPESALNKRPSFKLGVLTTPTSLEKFLAAFDWTLCEIKAAEAGQDLE